MQEKQLSFILCIYSCEVIGVQVWKTLFGRRSLYGFICFIIFLVVWLWSPQIAVEAAKNGLSLCGCVIIPSLFPFIVLSELFVRRGYHQYLTALLGPVLTKVFGLPSHGAAALVMGMVGGYPVGASTGFSLYDDKKLTEEETGTLLCFCNNAGPAFILGVVGGVLLKSPKAALLLYITHLVSALLIGLVCVDQKKGGYIQNSSKDEPITEASRPFAIDFTASVERAFQIALQICGFLVFFSVLISYLRASGAFAIPAKILNQTMGMDTELAYALLTGMVELSTGITELCTLNISTLQQLLCASFLLGWGGLCIHAQVLSLRGTRIIGMTGYFLCKLLQGILSVCLISLFWYAPILLMVIFFFVICLIIYRCVSKKSSRKMSEHGV